MKVHIDRFTYFSGFVEILGRIEGPPWPVRSVLLLVEDLVVAKAQVTPGGSPDMTHFHVRALTNTSKDDFRDVSLKVVGRWGKSLRFKDLGLLEVFSAPGHGLFNTFLAGLREAPAGRFLEVGSRARSGVTRRGLVPEGWDYTGLDIVPGENVDLVGDAHVMSGLLPRGGFQAAMSLSVFEHLAMPWKVAVELAKVMAPGGVVYIQTHQAFPLHDEPWDFWRVSNEAWPALFNRHTGFEIIEAAMAEPTFSVPHRWHPGVNYGDALGWALSSVLVRKVGEPLVEWPVPLSDVARDHYPG